MEPLGTLALLILLVPGITLLMALRIFYRRQVVTASASRMALSLAAWTLILLAGLGAGLGSLALLSTYYLPLLIIGLLMLVDRYRQGEHHALLHSLAFSAEKGVPLPEAARAFAQENSGDTGARAVALAERIEAGGTLASATRYARLRLSTAMRLAVNLSDVVVARGLALRAQLNWGNDADAALRMILNRLLYIFLLFHTLLMIVTFVMIRIVPVYQKMFEEFGLRLPPLTLSMISVSKYIVRGGWMMIVPFILLSVFALFVGVFFYTGWYDYPLFRLIYFLFGRYPEPSPGWWGQLRLLRYLLRIPFLMLGIGLISLAAALVPVFYWPGPMGGEEYAAPAFVVTALVCLVSWIFVRVIVCLVFTDKRDPTTLPDEFRLMDLAFFSRMFVWRYDASLVLRSLSLLMKQQLPLPQALVLLANVYPRGNVRRRLTTAALEIEQGADWKAALRRQWLLGSAEQALLAAAERVGNLPWALEEMGDALMRRMTYRLTVVYQIVFPIVLFSFAAFVGFFALALMMPLISLIQGLV